MLGFWRLMVVTNENKFRLELSRLYMMLGKTEAPRKGAHVLQVLELSFRTRHKV